jgi:hypothetical protein
MAGEVAANCPAIQPHPQLVETHKPFKPCLTRGAILIGLIFTPILIGVILIVAGAIAQHSCLKALKRLSEDRFKIEHDLEHLFDSLYDRYAALGLLYDEPIWLGSRSDTAPEEPPF